MEDLEKEKRTYGKGKYYIRGFLCSDSISGTGDDVVAYCGGGKRYPIGVIKVKDEIIDAIQKSGRIVEGNFMSIHFRNTDLKNDIESYIKKVVECCKKYKKNGSNGLDCLYVATDDYNAFGIFEERLKGIIKVIRMTFPEDFGGSNLHYNSTDKKKVIDNCLIDIYNTLNSKVFIPSSNSGLSKWIVGMIKSKDDIFGIESNSIICP